MTKASAAGSAYLTCYNVLQSVGWASILVRLVNHLIEHKSLVGAYSAAGNLVCLLQFSAFLETVHAALGLVRTGALYAFMQWLGRSHVLLAIIAKIPEVQELPPVMITFLAWSTSEVIRYPQYLLTTMGMCPRWLTWLRYTAFIVLYPVGALYGEMYGGLCILLCHTITVAPFYTESQEIFPLTVATEYQVQQSFAEWQMLVMYQSLDLIEEQNLYGNNFKWLPFDYHAFVVGVMFVYPCLWLLLYLHMFRQRQSKLTRKGGSGNRRKTSRPKRVD